MKLNLMFFAATCSLFAAVPAAQAQSAQTVSGITGKKALVVYYSRTGSTLEIARFIQKAAGADIFRIEPAQPYPDDYRKTTELAKEQQRKGERPALKAQFSETASYEVIFVGFPIWWGTLPPPVLTFLESHDFAGKTIIPFITHGGSRWASSISDLKKVLADSVILEGFEVNGSRAKGAEKEVETWIKNLRL